MLKAERVVRRIDEEKQTMNSNEQPGEKDIYNKVVEKGKTGKEENMRKVNYRLQ